MGDLDYSRLPRAEGIKMPRNLVPHRGYLAVQLLPYDSDIEEAEITVPLLPFCAGADRWEFLWLSVASDDTFRTL